MFHTSSHKRLKIKLEKNESIRGRFRNAATDGELVHLVYDLNKLTWKGDSQRQGKPVDDHRNIGCALGGIKNRHRRVMGTMAVRANSGGTIQPDVFLLPKRLYKP